MDVRQFLRGKFVTTQDVVGGPMMVRVNRWSVEDLPLGGEKFCIWFADGAQGEERALPLNKSTMTYLIEAFGEDAQAWVGKQLELFLDSTVRGPGGRTGGVRVRAVSLTAPTSRAGGEGSGQRATAPEKK